VPRTVPAVILLAAISLTGLSALRGQEAPRASLSLDVVNERWTGDFGDMVKRRRIRILTPYNRTHYFVEGGVQRGLVYEAGLKLEAESTAASRRRRRRECTWCSCPPAATSCTAGSWRAAVTCSPRVCR
jgi:hypothetical protein